MEAGLTGQHYGSKAVHCYKETLSLLKILIMHFIYVLGLTGPYNDAANWDEEADKILSLHWNYLVDLHKKGIMQVVGRTNYEPGHPGLMGIAIFKAETEAAATEIMNNDPCVKYGVMTAKVHPFNLALMQGMPA